MALGIFLAAFLAFPGASPSLAQEGGGFSLGCFHGLNDYNSPAVLPSCESSDLLNVESNLDGSAILKRKGFQLFGNLSISTSPVTGSHSFIDSSGNRLDIVCQDRNCAKSTNGNAFATFLTTAASGVTRWSFVDVGGKLYGANSKRDPILQYDGTTLSYPSGMPAGTILELTQDRLIVGDISGQPNRVHYSSAGAYTEFTLGVNPEDSFFDDVGTPGDKVRGLKCINGLCYIFKTASITVCELADQYNTRCSVLSPSIGTTDPASIVAAGGILYFRAQDKNYWEIGPQGLRQISRKIINFVKSQSGGLAGGENSNTQTTQADWDAGSQTPASSWNTSIINGSIFPSSSTLYESSAAEFATGTNVGLSTNNVAGTLTLLRSTFAFTNGDFTSESVSGGQPSTTNWDMSDGNWIVSGDTMEDTGPCGFTTTAHRVSVAPSLGHVSQTALLEVLDPNLNVLKACNAIYNCGVSPCTFTSTTCEGVQTVADTTPGKNNRIFIITSSTLTTSSVKARITVNGWKEVTTAVIKPQQISIEMGSWDEVGLGRALFAYVCSTVNYVATGTRTSPIFDTAFSTPTYGTLSATFTALSGESNIAFYTQTSTASDGGGFSTIATTSDTLRITSPQRRYLRYVADFASSVSTKTPSLSEIAIVSATTGTFRTQCIQPNSSISAWGALNCGTTLAGNGSLVFYSTSAATCATLPTGAANTWATTETNNATLTIATNTAVYIGWRSLLGSATDQAQVDSCILNWNEGTPAQPSWAAYDSVKNAIYWTTTINNFTSSNRLLKYDLNLEQWYPFDIPAQAPRIINNVLYFGGASSGTWNIYGGVDADLGAAINAYWKSKDIGSDSPFREKDFRTLSLLNRNNGTGNMTGTYTYSNSETGSYTVSLSTGSGINYARSNFYLPKTSPQNFVNVQVGNNSGVPFEVLGIGLTWVTRPWIVGGP